MLQLPLRTAGGRWLLKTRSSQRLGRRPLWHTPPAGFGGTGASRCWGCQQRGPSFRRSDYSSKCRHTSAKEHPHPPHPATTPSPPRPTPALPSSHEGPHPPQSLCHRHRHRRRMLVPPNTDRTRMRKFESYLQAPVSDRTRLQRAQTARIPDSNTPLQIPADCHILNPPQSHNSIAPAV